MTSPVFYTTWGYNPPMAEQRDDALLLRSIPYSDSSLILHVLTREFGRISLMARGARRAKSPFRGGLMPLHQLNIRWREPRSGSMGTLLEVQRLQPLLSDHLMLAGQELLASASILFPDGVSHGYQELHHAFSILARRPEDSGVCAATWKMLESSGWIGDFEHCWHCVEHFELNTDMYWREGHLLCRACASKQGVPLSVGFRKSIAGHMQESYVRLNQEHLKLWRMMIQSVFKAHQIQQHHSNV